MIARRLSSIVSLLVFQVAVAEPPDFAKPTRMEVSVLRHGRAVSAIAISPNGKLLASGGWDNTIRIWDLATGKEVQELRGHRKEVECVAFAPDGKTIASGAWDATVRLWDVATGKELKEIGQHPDGILTLAYSPDGKILATAGQKSPVNLWDTETGKQIRVFAGPPNTVNALAFAADGKTIASAGADSQIRIWNVTDGKQTTSMAGHDSWVFNLAFSADGQTLASAGADKTVRIWELASGKQIRLMEGHQDKVRSVAFSFDNRMLISSGIDKTIRLWEVASGKERRQITGHTAGVRSIALSGDGRILASGSSDTTIRVQPLVDEMKTPEKLETKELEALWTTLAGDDAPKAYQAVRTLAAAGQSVPFLQERIQESGKPDEKKLARLIAELDHDQFAVREKATRELEKFGGLAEEALRKALADNPSVEVRRRIESILDKTGGAAAQTPDQLRLVRAMEVLESAEITEAKAVLSKLAEGAAGPRLAREAQAAIKRLGKRGKS
jgi:dipeptidyl aminopeptidase/acylaminoacyl peptidase